MTRTFKIGNCVLTKKLWKNLLKKCDNNEYEAIKILYRSRKAKKLSNYIRSGLKKGWLLEPCRDEIDDPRRVNDAIDKFKKWLNFVGWN